MFVENFSLNVVGNCTVVRLSTELENHSCKLFDFLKISNPAFQQLHVSAITTVGKDDDDDNKHSIEFDVFPSSSSAVCPVYWKDGVRFQVPEFALYGSSKYQQNSDADDGHNIDISDDDCEVQRRSESNLRVSNETPQHDSSVKVQRKNRCVLPLAPVASPNFNYDAFCELWNELPPTANLSTMVAWMTSDALSKILVGKPFRQARERDCVTRNMSNDIQVLIDSGTIEPVPQYGFITNLLTAVGFKVPKSDGKTSRFVWNGNHVRDHLWFWFRVAPRDMTFFRV
jgi:hypothetical protein